MFTKKISYIFSLGLILLMSLASIAQAAPPLQEPEGGDTTSTTSDSLNLNEKGENLGCIMSERCEAGGTDTDGDGIPDEEEIGDDPDNPTDTDGDGLPDYLDQNDDNPDSNGNGIPDGEEGTGDADGDGIPDYLDPDNDNNDVPDSEEIGDPDNPTDTDGDGLPDYLDQNDDDPDSNGNGIPDGEEGTGDIDGDGIPDYLDPDNDNDGIPDSEEGTGDSDGDGIPDYLDGDSTGEDGGGHPVATKVAEYFDVPYDQVINLHESGMGFGVIVKWYYLSEKIGVSPTELMDSGIHGWGNILKEYGYHPSGKFKDNQAGEASGDQALPPGQSKKGSSDDTIGAFAGPGGGKGNNGQGNGNKGGNGKGVNGKPSDKSDDGGNGKGNKGGNGGGNGKGRGKNK